MLKPPETLPPTHPRRTGQLRLGGRSERVVRDVTRATAAELARVGYAELRVEDVAAQAGVNKTTVYRRWPTKADLVTATLRTVNEPSDELPDLGSAHLDLLALLRQKVERSSTCEGLSIHRVMALEMDHPEVASIAQALRKEHRAPFFTVIERAVKRGELPEGSDPDLIVEMIMGPVFNKLLRRHEPVDEAFLVAVVDMVVLGAKSGGAVRHRHDGGRPPKPPGPAGAAGR